MILYNGPPTTIKAKEKNKELLLGAVGLERMREREKKGREGEVCLED